MQEQFPESPDSENEAAREGTAAHYVLECMLTDLAPMEAGSITDDGVVVTDEMVEAAEVVVNDVISVAGDNIGAVQAEKHIQIQRVHPSECAGTSDVVVYYNKGAGTLTVWDLKYGYGVVEPFENWQLICYAIGNLDQLTGGNGIMDQHIRVNMRIIQPRIYHPEGIVREWSVMGSDLRGYANILNERGAEALSPNPPCISGPQCKHCTARADCQSAGRASMNAIDVTNLMAIETIPPQYLATHRSTLLRAKEAIEHRLTGIDAQIMATIQNGTQVDGLALDNPPGRLKWNKPENEILALADLMGVDIGKRSLITPTQAIKLIDESVIKAYSDRPTGKAKIVDSKTTKAAMVFGKN